MDFVLDYRLFILIMVSFYLGFGLCAMFRVVEHNEGGERCGNEDCLDRK